MTGRVQSARNHKSVPNACLTSRPPWQLTRSPAVRPAVYKTAALPTELHRRVVDCIVVEPERMVVEPRMSAATVRRPVGSDVRCLAGSDRDGEDVQEPRPSCLLVYSPAQNPGQ